MNLEKLNLVELNAQELKKVEGGSWWPLITGFLDGIAGNFHGYIFGYEIW
jgi:hypothetical protein